MQNPFDQFDNPPAPMGPQPQPWPGAAPGMVTGQPIESPRLRSLDQSDVRVQLDREANARAYEGQRMEAERLEMARQKAIADQRAREANAGVDTTASQDQAAGHVVMLRDSFATLQDVAKNTPDQLKPSLKEFGVRWLLTEDPEALAALQPEQRQRAANAYNGAVDSAIWLMTGAAAPEDQVKRIKSNIAPGVFDKPALLADKHRRLLAYIAQARARAGAAQLKLDGKTPYTAEDMEGLDLLEAQAGMLYGIPEQSTASAETELTRGQGETKNIPIPPQMQAEHDQFMKAAQPGQLKLDQYVGYYNDLTKRYGIEGNVDLERAKAYVDAFNAGKPTSGTLPPPEVEQGEWEKISGGAAASPLGTGAKNFASAMTMGLPELLAGSEGREASAIADELNPSSAVTGEVLGSVMPGVGLEKLGAKFATKALGMDAASRGARIGADIGANALYGGATEFNQTGDANEAAMNALMGGASVLPARGIAKGFAELKPKEFRKGLKDLGPQEIFDDNGNVIGKINAADLTTAQRAGMTGGEEFLSGLPGVSPMRQKAVASYNRHNAERAMAKAGLTIPKNIEPGQEMNAYVHKTLQQEYDKLAPAIKGKIDRSYKNAFAAIRNTTLSSRGGKSIDPEIQEMWQRLEDANAKFTEGGKFDYESYKKFSSDLREWQDFWGRATVGTTDAPSPLMNEMARVADQVRMKARELVSRANPTAGARLKRLDSAWAHKLRIEEASKGAAAQERGVYAPSEMLSATQRMDTSKGKGAFARGKAFDQDYTQGAQEVMGGKPAKGGSVLATGALGYTVGGAALSPALLASYAPGIKRLTQALTDGRFGAKLDKLTPDVIAKEFPELPSDVIKQVIASYLREKTVGN